MLILLPPSETKEFGTNRAKLNLAKLCFPELTASRQKVLFALLALSKSPNKAIKVLGISQKQVAEVVHNSELETAKTSAAISIYNGVLFDAFDYQTLKKSAQKKADESVLITSALFGLLKLQDSIPHYRLSGDTTLPKIGGVSNVWKQPTDLTMKRLSPDLIIDMRPSVYAKFWQPTGDLISKTVVIKIMTEVGSGKSAKKIAISHSNKLTKGLLAREIVGLSKTPKTSRELFVHLTKQNWECVLQEVSGKPDLLEIFI